MEQELKLNSEDIKLLKEWGYPECDFSQIQEAIYISTYDINEKKISAKKALKLLGRRKFLAGISRSAFHWSSCQLDDNGNEISFDSRKLFR